MIRNILMNFFIHSCSLTFYYATAGLYIETNPVTESESRKLIIINKNLVLIYNRRIVY